MRRTTSAALLAALLAAAPAWACVANGDGTYEGKACPPPKAPRPAPRPAPKRPTACYMTWRYTTPAAPAAPFVPEPAAGPPAPPFAVAALPV